MASSSDHSHFSSKPNPGYTDVPGIGLIPAGPKSHRPTQLLPYSGSRYASDHWRPNPKPMNNAQTKRPHPYRRPSPVPDRRGTSRQAPCDGVLRNRQTRQDRSESPGLFFCQDSPHDDPYSNSTSDHDDSGSGSGSDVHSSENEARPPGDDTPSESEDANTAATCECPISLHCQARDNSLIDCRTLVLERECRYYLDRMECEEIDIALIPETAEFVTEDRVREVLQLCNNFHQHAPGAQQRNFWDMVLWVTDVRIKSITQATLDSTQVLLPLKTFLDNPVNPQEHDQKRTPDNLREDIGYIYDKWSRGDLLADANRGLRLVAHVSAGGRSSARLRIDEDWEHRKHDTYYGHGHLFHGQRWNSRIEMSRDGAHGPLIAGIAGSITQRARSVVMGYHNVTTQGYYAGVDMRNRIYYIGTALPEMSEDNAVPTNLKDTAAARNRNVHELKPTYHTQMLLKSIETGLPVRVFRSHRLARIVKHKPMEGYRYDGLYRVTRAKLLKNERQIYRFTMQRLHRGDPDSGNQGPLRGVRQARN